MLGYFVPVAYGPCLSFNIQHSNFSRIRVLVGFLVSATIGLKKKNGEVVSVAVSTATFRIIRLPGFRSTPKGPKTRYLIFKTFFNFLILKK